MRGGESARDDRKCFPAEQVRTQGPQPGAVTARERAASGDVPDEVIDQDGNRPERIPVAIRPYIERKVQALRWSTSPRQEHLDVVGHASHELRPMGRTGERAAARVGEEERGLREPATQRDAVWRLQRTDPRTSEHCPSEAHLERAHPAGVALGAHAGGHASDPHGRLR